MHPIIFVPGLLWPSSVLRDTVRDQSLPTLAWLLGRAQSQSHQHGVHHWLAGHCGLAMPLPVAPLRLLADAVAAPSLEIHPRSKTLYWLCLDPAPVSVQARAVLLTDPASLALNEDENQALCTALIELLAPFGQLFSFHSGRWYLGVAGPTLPEATSLPEAIDEPLPVPFPTREASSPWRATLMEAQMLLANHPISRLRQAAGRPTPAILWPWGGGSLPATVTCPWTSIVSDDPLLRGLALAAGLSPSALPKHFEPDEFWDNTLIHLPHCASTGRNALAWLAALHDLERHWLKPMLEALDHGVLSGLTLVAGGRREIRQWTLRRRQRWYFWQRPASLLALTDNSTS